MYDWRKMNEAQRQDLLQNRLQRQLPWHSPPHRDGEKSFYHLTAACFEHRPIIGVSPERMFDFSTRLLNVLTDVHAEVEAWCVLPNHYHVLLRSDTVLVLLQKIGRLHGATSFQWNGEDDTRGRQVWCKAADRAMRSERHYWTTMNYIHHNPVRHGYVTRWQDWPFSSAPEFLETSGNERATALWRDYPILEYGKGWDEF